MQVKDLDIEHIGAPVTLVVDGATVSGNLIGFGWGGTQEGEAVTHSRLRFYGGSSVDVPLETEITIET